MKIGSTFLSMKVFILSVIGGRVLSLSRRIVYANGKVIFKRQITMINKPSTGGYEMVSLTKNHDPKPFLIHRLVAQLFIPNKSNLPQVNHIEGNKKDNRWYMLEWCDQFRNMQHAVAFGLQANKPLKRSENGRAKKVIDSKTGKIYGCIIDACEDMGIARSRAKKMLYNKHGHDNGLSYVS